MANGAIDILDAVETEDGAGVTATLEAMNAQWATHRATGDAPPLLAIQMDRALDVVAGDPLSSAIDDRNVEGVREAAVRVAQASLDLQLQYRSPAEIDLARFGLWARQLVVDSSSDEPDPGHIAGDVTTLELIWDRIAHTLDDTAVSDIEAQSPTSAPQPTPRTSSRRPTPPHDWSTPSPASIRDATRQRALGILSASCPPHDIPSSCAIAWGTLLEGALYG